MKLVEFAGWLFTAILVISGLFGAYTVGMNLYARTTGIINNGIPQSGSIGVLATGGLDIYSDPACTVRVTSVAWGNVNPATSYPKTFYMKNSGTSSAKLNVFTESYVPTNAVSFVTFSTDRQGIWMSPGAITKITITLTCASNSGTSGITSWSCTLVIQSITA